MKIWKTKISVKFLILLLLLQISYIYIEIFKCTANKHKEPNFCHNFYRFTSLGMQCGIDASILVLWIGQLLLSILQSLTSPVKLSWMLVGAIRITSFFNLWKLYYFSDIASLRNPLSNSTNHIRFFSVILESGLDSRYILLDNWRNSYQRFPRISFCITWESQCTKIIVARLLQLSVVPELYLYH